MVAEDASLVLTSGKSGTKGFLLKPECAAEMLGTFRNATSMYALLGTNAVTWKQFTTGHGIGKNTAVSIILKYFDLLTDLARDDFASKAPGVHTLIAKQKYKAHLPAIEGANWREFVA